MISIVNKFFFIYSILNHILRSLWPGINGKGKSVHVYSSACNDIVQIVLHAYLNLQQIAFVCLCLKISNNTP